MNIQTLQLVSMITHGNAVLSGKELPEGYKEYLHNNLFQFADKIEFSLAEGDPLLPRHIASDILAWFDWLKLQKAKHLYFHTEEGKTHELEGSKIEPYALAGMVGGGNPEGIIVVYDDRKEIWFPYAKVNEEDYEKRAKVTRIWDLSYVGNKLPDDFSVPQSDMDTVKESSLQLKRALDDIYDFAKSNNLNHWAENFDGARKRLDVSMEGGYIQAEIYDSSSVNPNILRLLSAAGSSDVFGGMGSWNDAGFSGDPEYERVSSNLYKTMCQAIADAVNAI